MIMHGRGIGHFSGLRRYSWLVACNGLWNSVKRTAFGGSQMWVNISVWVKIL
jgi:hypothetical protein